MFLNKKTSTIYFLNFSICFEVIVCQFIQCESLMFLHNSNILIDKNKNNYMFCINVIHKKWLCSKQIPSVIFKNGFGERTTFYEDVDHPLVEVRTIQILIQS